jgi:hypothetical protein
MSGTMTVAELSFAPHGTESLNFKPAAASLTSVARFEQLLYSPGAMQGHAAVTQSGAPDLRAFLDGMSHRWDAGQSALMTMSGGGPVSAKDLILMQMQMTNCALDVEVSSKCAGILENGVQTLTQRPG